MSAKQPTGEQTLRAHMTVHDAKAAIDFYAKAFGAEEVFRLVEPAGRVGHAEIRIGDTLLMLNDEYPDFGARSPAAIGGSPVAFYIRVADADAAVKRAVKAGATIVRPVEDQFYGERMGMVACPFGYRWSLSVPKEELDAAEMQKRWTRMLEGGKA
ncbi:MAG: VOC family protein [Reyranella sp.]|nr:VOC family protein [Reyranella sp.]